MQKVWKRKADIVKRAKQDRGRRTAFQTAFWLSSLLIFLLSGLTGCAGGQKEREQELAPEREKLVVWSYYEVEAQRESLNRLMADFNAAQQQYEARWEYVPMTEFNKRLAIGVTEEDMPDIVIIDNPDMEDYVRMGLFEDITDYVKEWDSLEDYYPQTLETVRMDGRYYGIPFCCNNLALFYNRDLLEQKGAKIPEDWESFYRTAKLLSDADTYGFAMSAVEGEQAAFQVLPWILAQGSGKKDFTTEEAAAAFAKIQELTATGLLDPNCINWSQNDVARKFIAGEAAMMENGPWILPMLEEAGVAYGIAELPFGQECHTITGGENLGVLKGKNVEGAVALLRYYSRDEVMSQVCRDTNVLPPRRSLAKELAQEKSVLSIFERQMEEAVPRTAIDGWNSRKKALPTALYDVITMSKTPQQAAEDIGKET